MMKFAQYALLSAILAMAPFATATSAAAGDRYYHQHRSDADALALGVIGLATGVIVGSALANQPRSTGRVYIDPPPSVYDDEVYYAYDDFPPPPRSHRRTHNVRSHSVEPWTGAWYDYCSQRYRSFNPRTGTFIGFDGRTHFCTVR